MKRVCSIARGNIEHIEGRGATRRMATAA